METCNENQLKSQNIKWKENARFLDENCIKDQK